ncbi:MAG TPA: ATP-binding protein [bacterium]|nr:ATP-binding protein [bacterium]
MGKVHGIDVRALRQTKSPAGAVASRSAVHGDLDDFFADLRSSFLDASKAERCVIKLAPGWRRIVGQWLGPVPDGEASADEPDFVPVSWIKVRHEGSRSEVRVNLLLGGSSAAQIVVTTRKKRGLAQILRVLTTFIPKVSSRLCLRWLREEANAYERRRLAQDLHDGPLQIATATKIRLQSRRQFAEDGLAAQGLDEAIELTGQVIASMRSLLHERMTAAESPSLKTHLRRAAGRWGELTGMRVHFSFPENAPDEVRAFSKETLEVAEHVVSESIVNAWKHGKATQLSVSCHPQNGGMLLTLRDDGCGFRASVEPEAGDGTKMGLRLLRSRVNELGGRFDVRSPQDGGTIVETWLPPHQGHREDPA